MQTLQPKVKELQEKYKGDQQTLRQEMMKLYQTEKVNPLMGCLPMFLQIPVFLGLFHVLSYLNPLKEHDPDKLYGWTTALFDSASHAKLFGAPIAMAFRSSADEIAIVGGEPMAVKVVAAILVIMMMFTTFLTSRQMILKTGWQADPQQRMIQKLMLYGIPISLLLSGWYFPVGVVIYWVTQNIFSLGQQYWVLHKYPPPVTATSTGKAGPDAMRKSAVARFFAGEPIRLPAAPPRPARPVSPVQPSDHAGTRSAARPRRPSRRSPPETRSLAPRPGAKPVPPKATKPGLSTNGATPAKDTPPAPTRPRPTDTGSDAARPTARSTPTVDGTEAGGTPKPPAQKASGQKARPGNGRAPASPASSARRPRRARVPGAARVARAADARRRGRRSVCRLVRRRTAPRDRRRQSRQNHAPAGTRDGGTRRAGRAGRWRFADVPGSP